MNTAFRVSFRVRDFLNFVSHTPMMA
jgi:hypothetical protein